MHKEMNQIFRMEEQMHSYKFEESLRSTQLPFDLSVLVALTFSSSFFKGYYLSVYNLKSECKSAKYHCRNAALERNLFQETAAYPL